MAPQAPLPFEILYPRGVVREAPARAWSPFSEPYGTIPNKDQEFCPGLTITDNADAAERRGPTVRVRPRTGQRRCPWRPSCREWCCSPISFPLKMPCPLASPASRRGGAPRLYLCSAPCEAPTVQPKLLLATPKSLTTQEQYLDVIKSSANNQTVLGCD